MIPECSIQHISILAQICCYLSQSTVSTLLAQGNECTVRQRMAHPPSPIFQTPGSPPQIPLRLSQGHPFHSLLHCVLIVLVGVFVFRFFVSVGSIGVYCYNLKERPNCKIGLGIYLTFTPTIRQGWYQVQMSHFIYSKLKT